MMQNKTIVCFSYNSPPQNDPEAFCTARFLSSIAKYTDYKIHWVTMRHSIQMEEEVVDELIDNKIIITRLDIPQKPNKAKIFLSNLEHCYLGDKSWEINFISKKLKEIVRLYDKPVLLTRSLPILSNIIGYRLRNDVQSWIAHFSDPFPGFDSYSRSTYYKKYFDDLWAKKILKHSNHITVTCNYAKHFYTSIYSFLNENKVSVVYHVGFPLLSPKAVKLNMESNDFKFVHVGNLTDRRYVENVINEFDSVNSKLSNVKFVQFGLIDVKASKMLDKKFAWLKSDFNNLTSPRESSYILDIADVNVVIDTHENIPYSPYLPSKFAYALASNKPILAIGRENSEMAELSKKHPSIYFADITKKGDLAEIVKKIVSEKDKLMKPQQELQNLFKPETIANDFYSMLNKMDFK